MQWLILVSLLFLTGTPGAKPPCCQCLPKGIEPTDIVSYRAASLRQRIRQAITVEEKVASLKARCKRGKLVDASGKEIYFFRMTGCWGNPPDDYQETLEKQNRELIRLRKRYTVIEMTCNPSGQQIP